MEAESSRTNIKIKIGQTVIIFKASPGFELDILDHAHGVNTH